jgi:hypothetical protein
MNSKIFALLIGCVILLSVIELVRRDKLTFKYAVGWIGVCVGAMFFVIFDRFLFKLAYWFGFQLPSNFVFFVILSGFIFLSLLLTTFLCQQNNRNDMMAQKIGILELEVKKLKDNQK